MAESPKFRISSALKTILGKELITDNHIAILELVKNSFDADAKRVDVQLVGLTTGNPRIIIKDDGNGMSKNDILNKWLFVAYSSKKGGDDYRNRLASGRPYAGAKGVGRFSCDRLGSKLTIYTREKGKGPTHKLVVNWGDFERDQEAEFQTIKTRYTEETVAPAGLKYGTILEISDLRDQDWNRNDLLKLRRKLERLINPNPERIKNDFSIYLDVPDETINDREAESQLQVNGKIENKVFEALEIKTTHLQATVSPDGKSIVTRLMDRGVLIFEIEEDSPYGSLHDVSVQLFHLTSPAKTEFTKYMGIRIREYGSIFMYKNGFRIHPFGDPGDDQLGIDRRQTQGMFRRLGTRDLAGRIEITGVNSELRETSSRDGGLIKTDTYNNLKKFFFAFALRRLESYVITFSKYGITSKIAEKGELPPIKHIKDSEFQEWLLSWVRDLTGSENVKRFHFDQETINVLKTREANSAGGILRNFERIAADSNDPALMKQAARARKHFLSLSKAKAEAEAEAAKAKKQAVTAKKQAQAAEADKKEIEKRALYLQAVIAREPYQQVAQHLLPQYTSQITEYSKTLLNLFNRSALDVPDRWRDIVSSIVIAAHQVETVSRFGIHANFAAESDDLNGDLLKYIEEYIENVLKNIAYGPIKKTKTAVYFSNPKSLQFTTKFKPIRLIIILDNLIGNSVKNGATKIQVSVLGGAPDSISVRIQDDGSGIPKDKMDDIFKIGFTTSKHGTGLGLYHVRQLMADMKGTVSIDKSFSGGAAFILKFPK